MKKKFVKIPIDLSSKKSLRLLVHTRKNQTNKPINELSFDIRNKSYNKIINNNNNSLIKIPKNTKEFLVSKGNDIFPFFKSQDLNKESYKISTYKKERITETEYNQNDSKNIVYNLEINNRKVFNGKSNKIATTNIYDNINNEEKKKDNCCYYESKYSKLVTEEKEKYSINRRVKEKYINNPNENKNTSNIQSDNISKRIIFDSNIGKST